MIISVFLSLRRRRKRLLFFPSRIFLLSFSLSLSLFTLSLSYSYSLSFYLKSKIFTRRIRFQPIRRYSFYSDLIAMVIFLTLCSFFSFFLSLFSLCFCLLIILTHIFTKFTSQIDPRRPTPTRRKSNSKWPPTRRRPKTVRPPRLARRRFAPRARLPGR